jgi:ribosomal protein S26
MDQLRWPRNTLYPQKSALSTQAAAVVSRYSLLRTNGHGRWRVSCAILHRVAVVSPEGVGMYVCGRLLQWLSWSRQEKRERNAPRCHLMRETLRPQRSETDARIFIPTCAVSSYCISHAIFKEEPCRTDVRFRGRVTIMHYFLST